MKHIQTVIELGVDITLLAVGVVIARRCASKKPSRLMAIRERGKKTEKEDPLCNILKEFTDSCFTSYDSLHQIVDDFIKEMHAGLDTESTLKMLPSFVDVLPKGDERGLFYSLDMGYSNCRVLRVEFGGKEVGIIKQESEEIYIPQKLRAGSGKELFKFIANELRSFVDKEGEGFSRLETNEKREMSFTFSFPVNQTSINSGTLVHRTKGLTCYDMAGKEMVHFLQEAMTTVDLDMRVTVLVNDDTVGTLARARYADKDVMVAIRLDGKGTNACYVERSEAIKKLKGVLPKSKEMVINTGWGSFQSSHLPITYVDNVLDKESANPGEQLFEKLVTGTYMGDIVRRVLINIANGTSLFGEPFPRKLLEPYILSTPHLTKIHGDEETSELKDVAQVMEDIFNIKESCLITRQTVHSIVKTVLHRGARLVAAGIVAIVEKIGYPRENTHDRIVITMDGDLYENDSEFRNVLLKSVTTLLGRSAKANQISIELSKDGSGIGAALIAASYSREEDKSLFAETSGGDLLAS